MARKSIEQPLSPSALTLAQNAANKKIEADLREESKRRRKEYLDTLDPRQRPTLAMGD